MSKNYEITKELRQASLNFLNEFGNYQKCLEILSNEEKSKFTEEEVNELLNLLGSFRLRDVFNIVERFKVEVTPLKPETDEQSEPITGQAE